MQEFAIIDEKRYPLPTVNSNNILPYHRNEHRVTVGYHGRRLMVMLDNLTSKVYVEEITSGRNEYIDDDNLVYAVCRWANELGFLNVLPPIMKEGR